MSSATDPSATPDPDVLSYHEYRTDEELENKQEAIRQRVKTAIDDGHKAQSKGEYDQLAQVIAGGLLPALEIDRWSLWQYDEQLAYSPYGWDMAAVTQFFENQDRYLTPEGEDATEWLAARSNRGETAREHRQRILDTVFESLESAAIVEGHLPSKLEKKQSVFEYSHQVGERYLRADSSAGGDLETIDPDDDWKATLLAGGQGSGKSTASGTLIEDRYSIGNKVVDLVDLSKAENVTHDIEDQSKLSQFREEMGLDVGFEEFDQPDIEILVPLTRELEDARVPTNVETGEPVVTPFTIPASELTYRQLVMLLPHTTEVQEQHLRSAHERLSRERSDWSLSDLARAVRDDPKAGEKISDRIESSLRTVQNKSFIRDGECEHKLEWGPIMKDAETITAFTLFQIRERIDKLLIISYLIDSLYDARHKLLRQGLLPEFPALTCVMREMHQVAPRNKAEQSSESTIEGVMVDNLSDLFALMRHVNMEVIADTQKFHRQLHPSISSLFHRVYAFGGQKPDIEKIFKTRVNPNGNPAQKVADYENGECALVSGSIGGYKMPIKFAPPRHHHLDAQEDGDGFTFRTKVLKDEEMKPSPWDASVPDRLLFTDESDDPVIKFFEKFLTYTGNETDYTVKEEITDAYNDWADVNGYKIVGHNRLHEKLVKHFELDKSESRYRPTVNGEQKMAHRCIRMRF